MLVKIFWVFPKIEFKNFAFIVFSIFVFCGNLYSQFDPSGLPNLKLWLSADSVEEAGGFVDTWYDLSGNNYNLSQSVALLKPLKIENQLNGRPAIRFDGTDDYLKTLFGQTYSTPITVFMVLKNSSSNPVFVYDGGNNYLSMIYVANNIYIQSGLSNISYFKPAPFNFHLFQNEYNTSQSKIYENEELKLNGFLPPAILDGFTVGSRYLTDTYFFNGDVAEVIVYNSILSSAQKQEIEKYIHDKYAPLFSLGDDINTVNYCATNLSVDSGYSNIVWSTGETSTSINVNQSGTYFVQGKDQFGYLAHDTIVVTYPTIPPPTFNGICVNETMTWNADMGPGYTYFWSTGETSPSINITTAGNYSVQVTDGLGCVKNSEQYNFTIDTYSQTANLGNDTSLCSGNLIALQVGAAETVDYLWNGTLIADQPPFWVVDTTGNYFVESTNINGCIARDTILVTITGIAPTANFSTSNVCRGADASFLDLSVTPDLSPVDEWLWTFGDGNQDVAQNPSHVFTETGIYFVQLYVAQGGCGAFFTAPIEVYSLPEASFDFSGVCTGDPTSFVNSSVNGDGEVNAWLWNFGQPSSGLNNVSSQQNPLKLYGEVGSFDVNLQVTDDNGCVDDTLRTVVIGQSPLAEMTASAACQDALISFTNTSSIQSPNFIQAHLWDFGDNSFSILPVPNKSFNLIGYHTITLTVTADNGCMDAFQTQQFVHAIPVPAFNVGPACVGTYTELSDVSAVLTGSVAASNWEIDVSEAATGSPAYIVFTTTGDHSIKLTTTSDFGCVNDTMLIVNVGNEVNADFSINPTVIIGGDGVQFLDGSIGADAYYWDFGDETNSILPSPVNTYPISFVDSEVSISLVASNSLGCSDTVVHTFLVTAARFDLAVNAILVDEENGYYTMGIELKNIGSSIIEYTDLKVSMSNGTSLLDRYEDTLQSGESGILILGSFPSAYFSDQDAVEGWICAEGIPYSSLNILDEDFSNNILCRNIEGEKPILIGPNPNPASEQFAFSVLVSKEATLSIYLTDSRGRIVQQFYTNATLEAGLYPFKVPLQTLGSGVYILRMISGDQEVVRKVVVE